MSFLKRLCRKLQSGALGLYLLLCVVLSGCAAPLQRPQNPPSGLTEATPTPTYTGSTNADLARYTQALRYSLEACNSDKATLREFYP